MSECRNLLKLKFKRKDYKFVLSKLFNKESLEFDFDDFYGVPKTLRMPICREDVPDVYDLGNLRLVEYAALEYLLSLNPYEFQDFGLTFYGRRFGPRASLYKNKALSVIHDRMDSDVYEKHHQEIKPMCEELFQKFYSEHEEELTNLGIFSMKDYGKVVVDNLCNYNCVERESWIARNYGSDGSELSDDTYKNADIKVATNGKDTLYFDVKNIYAKGFVRLLGACLFNGKDVGIDVDNFDTSNNQLESYSQDKSNRLPLLLSGNLRRKVNFIVEFNDAFGEERYALDNLLEDESAADKGSVTSDDNEDNKIVTVVYVKKDLQ